MTELTGVAEAMVRVALARPPGLNVFESDRIVAIARGGAVTA